MSSSQVSNTLSGHGVLNNGSRNIAAGRDINVYNTVAPTRNDEGGRHAEPQEKHRQSLLASLRFDAMDSRYWNIKRANTKTCEWFLENVEYLEWLKDNPEHAHGRFLWIKGKPGAGKSTIMKFVLDRTNESEHLGATLSFFFNARAADEMMRSTLGLYRSLAVQLLKIRPQLEFVLDQFQAGHKWCIESLKQLFGKALRALGDTPVVCFIDALDECPEQEVRDMIEEFSELCHALTRLRVCFSSRHYPNIAVPKGAHNVVLERMKEHDQDIADYINHSLHMDHGTLSERITTKVLRKASGVFMWVVLVVPMLNKAYDSGGKPDLEQRLREIPGDLHKLFRDMLARDNENRPALLLCMQWLLFGKGGLRVEELYFAIVSGVSPERLTQSRSDDITKDDMKKFVLDKSKGLIELQWEYGSCQFIHESVRDFLLKDNGLAEIWPDAPLDLEGMSHDALKKACLVYMESEFVAKLGISPTSNIDQDLYDEIGAPPFLSYVVRNILKHANEAQAHGYDQSQFLAEFPLNIWAQLDSEYFEWVPYSRNKEVPVSDPDLLYVLALLDLGALIRAQPKGPSLFNTGHMIYLTPIFSAHYYGNADAYQALIERQQRTDDSNVSVQSLEVQLNECTDCDWAEHIDIDWTKSTLSLIVEARCETLLKVYCATQQIDFESLENSMISPLLLAAGLDGFKVAQVLIEHGANVNTQDGYGRTPLHIAAENGFLDLVKFLIEQGANVNTPDVYGQTPLYVAAVNEHLNSAEFLIEQGADINTPDVHGQTILHIAAYEGNSSIVQFLLAHNVNINAPDLHGRTPLHNALDLSHPKVAELLLEAGADMDAITNDGWSPLDSAVDRHFAIDRRHYDMVLLLTQRRGNPRIISPLN
ncbi:hypothetical protein PG988_016195 [Apiospora saccharicola]